MRLRLSLTSSAPGLTDHVGTCEFTETGGTIGRSSRNDWTLPDPAKVVSGRHAEVRFADGAFSIVDLSTNGVFLDGSLEPLGNGNAAPLRNGTRLRIGEFEILAELESEPLPAWPEQPSSGAGIRIPDDFLSGLGTTEPGQGADIHVNLSDLGWLSQPAAPAPGPAPAPLPTAPRDADLDSPRPTPRAPGKAPGRAWTPLATRPLTT
jgi:type VI secretion system FHA domain protein